MAGEHLYFQHHPLFVLSLVFLFFSCNTSYTASDQNKNWEVYLFLQHQRNHWFREMFISELIMLAFQAIALWFFQTHFNRYADIISPRSQVILRELVWHSVRPK